MSYEYFNGGLGALGWVRISGSCQVSGRAGILRCVPSEQRASATSQGARSIGGACSYTAAGTTRTGTKYCFPTAAAAPVEVPEEEPGAFEALLDELAQGAENTVAAVTDKFRAEGAPEGAASTAGKFAGAAQQVAIEEGQRAEDESIPWQETPEAPEGTWLQRYTPHITIASTLMGLGTFIVWLAVRKKDKAEERRF